MAPMRREDFEKAVAWAVDNLPEEFAGRMKNVDVIVQQRPSPDELADAGVESGETLLGLYHGVPLTERGMGYQFTLPDSISIYKEPIEKSCDETGIRVPEMVRQVVLHEIAHHFGISDDRLRELGY